MTGCFVKFLFPPSLLNGLVNYARRGDTMRRANPHSDTFAFSRALKRGNLWHFIGKLVCDFYDKISVKLCVDAREVYDRWLAFSENAKVWEARAKGPDNGTQLTNWIYCFPDHFVTIVRSWLRGSLCLLLLRVQFSRSLSNSSFVDVDVYGR